jgi:triacylglycerol lipase
MALNAMTTSYSIGNALALAEASRLAYKSPAEIQAGLAKPFGGAVKDFKFLNSSATDTQGFIAGFDDAIVLCFRGTESRADWLDDGNIRLVPFHDMGLIHVGFRDALDSVFKDIDETLNAWAGQGRTLWITGHSLGAALALLAAAYFRFPFDQTKKLPRPIAGLYTFGQPRVGTTTFCEAVSQKFGSSYFRFVNKQDIVPRVPPRAFGYWHAGLDRYIDSKNKIHNDPVWWQVFLDRVAVGVEAMKALQTGKVLVPDIQNHSMDEYVAAIEKN